MIGPIEAAQAIGVVEPADRGDEVERLGEAPGARVPLDRLAKRLEIVGERVTHDGLLGLRLVV